MICNVQSTNHLSIIENNEKAVSNGDSYIQKLSDVMSVLNYKATPAGLYMKNS